MNFNSATCPLVAHLQFCKFCIINRVKGLLNDGFFKPTSATSFPCFNASKHVLVQKRWMRFMIGWIKTRHHCPSVSFFLWVIIWNFTLKCVYYDLNQLFKIKSACSCSQSCFCFFSILQVTWHDVLQQRPLHRHDGLERRTREV